MMNDYIDYYNYVNNLNAVQNQNQTQNKVKNPISKNQNKEGLSEPYVGFLRGNMFDNLYYEYKNYRPQNLNLKNEREYALLLVQMYGFAAHDLGLYLDINPNDGDAIAKRSEYMKLYTEALMKYENTYGPITQNSEVLNSMPWAWNSKSWPWEGMK